MEVASQVRRKGLKRSEDMKFLSAILYLQSTEIDSKEANKN
jgi:hypothetical protein